MAGKNFHIYGVRITRKCICESKNFYSCLQENFSKGSYYQPLGRGKLLILRGKLLILPNGVVVKMLDSQFRGPVFKTTGWLQGQLSLSFLTGR